MRTTQEWLDAYGESHQNPTNKLIHWICVPLIVFSLLGLLWKAQIPGLPSSIAWLGNGATLLMLVAMVFYFTLSLPLALGMLVVSSLMLSALRWLDMASLAPLWLISTVIFVVAWVFQFIGHKIEGKKPSFLEDIQFLLIGPIWLLSFIYKKIGIRY